MTVKKTPYQDLNPSVILTAIESTGFLCTGSLFALNSYENRVYQIGIEGSPPFIVKFYRPERWSDKAILEEHQFALELAEAELPVVAPEVINYQTLHHYQGFRFALFKRETGRALDLDNLDHLEWMGRFVGRCHAVGACRDFRHRPRLDIEAHGVIPSRFLIEHEFIPSYLKNIYCETIDSLLSKIEKKFNAAGKISYIRIHGDCQIGNVLWNEAGPHIVDLDDCVMGPAIQDLWMLLSGNYHQKNVEMDRILSGYEDFHDFNDREITLIEALRTLRMIQYAAWLARRWEDPAFPRGFPWFNTSPYWEEHVKHLEDQNNLLDI